SGVFGSSDNILLGDFPHVGALAVGASYSQSQVIQVPAYTTGHFYLLIKTDANEQVYQYNYPYPNVGSPNHFVDIVPEPYAIMNVNDVTADTTGYTSQPINVSWMVSNTGIGPTDVTNWNDTVYVTSDPTGQTGLTYLGSFEHDGALAVGASYTRNVQVTLPESLSTGTYYIVVQTSGPYQFIYTSNDQGVSNAVHVIYIAPPQVALEVTNVTAPTTALDSSQVLVTWTVLNQGPADAAGPWTDGIYLAPNGNFSQATDLVNFEYVGGLNAGISYTRTEQVTLPETPGIFEFYIVTDIYDQVLQTSRAGDSLASAPITISLAPRPELEVSQISAPATVTSGGLIDVSYQVTNLGSAPTGTGQSQWTDAVYLSETSALNTSEAILLGTMPNVSALAIGQSYSNSASFTLPANVSGTAYIIVQTNSGNQVNEGPFPATDYASAAIAINSQPVEPPDLVMSNVFAPSEAFDGSTISVHYEVANLGSGPTYPASWTDEVWLTLGTDRPDPNRGDIELASFGHTGALQVGQYYTNTVQVTLPQQISGQYYITVWTDADLTVYETQLDVNVNPDAPNDLDGDNFQATPITVLTTPPADLVITSVIAPLQALGGSQVTVQWTVENEGSNPTNVGQWADAVYINTTPDLNGNPTLVFAVPHIGFLNPGQSYTQSSTFTLPPSAQGNYFVVETNCDPNLAEVPDDDSMFLAQLQQDIDNLPSGDLTNGNLTEQDIINALSDGSGQPTTVFEGPYPNIPVAAASDITNTPADLVVTNVTAPAQSNSGEPITISWTVLNKGAPVYAGTEYWDDFVYFSAFPNFSEGPLTLLDIVPHSNASDLGSGQSYTQSDTVTIPAGIGGTYYIFVSTDRQLPGQVTVTPGSFPLWEEEFVNSVWSTDLANDYSSTSLTVVYAEPALQVTSLSIPATGESGQTIPISFTVLNWGNRTTRVNSWDDGVYISQEPSLSDVDQIIGTFEHQGYLAPGQSYTVTGTVTLPNDISGPFYIIVYTDTPYFQAGPVYYGIFPFPEPGGDPRLAGGGSGPVNEYQNDYLNAADEPITVAATNLPDLVVSSVIAPQQVTVGQGFTVTYTVLNQGSGNVPADESTWYDAVYLSRNDFLDVQNDIFIAELAHIGVLDSEQSYSVTDTFAIPSGLTGAYYVIVLTNVPDPANTQGIVRESDISNNTTASTVPMLIDLPPPSDLQVDSVTIPQDAEANEPMSVTYTVSNHGTAPAIGSWSDSVFISPDDTFDTNAQLIGTYNVGSLLNLSELDPGQSYTATVTAALPVELPGNYYILVYTNVFDTIYEGPYFYNNVTAAANTVSVTVPPLTIGVPLNDTINSGESKIYALQTGSDDTVEIDLTSSGGANAVYADFEGMPSSQNFDAESTGHLSADQTVLIPSSEPGIYYILVSGVSEPQTDTPFQIVANVLPFEITNITPDSGGSAQYVTTTITGAGFSPSAIVRLVRPQFAEFAPVSYQVVNATEIVATFDLSTAPDGLYDVYVTNPDGSQAVLPYRFLVQAPEPINVSIGMGGPSQLQIGQTGVYGVTIQSLTNVDTPYVLFEYGVPNLPNPAAGIIPGPRLLFTTDLTGDPNLDGVPWPDLSSIVDLNGQFEAQGFAYAFAETVATNETFTLTAYPGLAQVLQQDPNFLQDLTPDEEAELGFSFYIEAAATPMTSAEYITYQTNEANTIRTAILSDPNAPQILQLAAADETNWDDAYLQALEDTGQLLPSDAPPQAQTSTAISSLMSIITAGLLGQPAGQSIIAAGNIDQFFAEVLSWYGSNDSLYGSSGLPMESTFDQGLSNPTHFEAFKIQVGENVNDTEISPPAANLASFFGITSAQSENVSITGPSGYGSDNFVPLETPLPYSISFQSPAGSAGAQSQIQILEQLDPNLDVRTFELSDIVLDGITIPLPSNQGSFTGTIDLTKQLGFILDVTAGVDVNTGIATWDLQAIDPSTGLPVATSALDILPEGGSGEVGYTIQPLSTTTTGTTISAAARVIYDQDMPQDTNTVTATVDADVPSTSFQVSDLGNGQYFISWQATEGSDGPGIANSDVYVSIDGVSYQVVDQYDDSGSFTYTAPPGTTPQGFVVISADNAGNVEPAPAGISLPPYNPQINLGTLPSAIALPPPPPTPPAPTGPSANPLFIQAEEDVPTPTPAVNPSTFSTVLEPFEAGSFVTDFTTSGADISPLGIAFSPDGEDVYVSGGAGRNSLWVFSRAGGDVADTAPLATLDEPIYDMAFDNYGELWATTGGGPLVQLDPNTGQIIASYGNGVTLGMAVDPNSNLIYLAYANGIETFNTVTHVFTPFSSTRVDGLAMSPDGTLWGVSWPQDGQVVEFSANGDATPAVTMTDPGIGLAFGQSGTPLANLLFVSHADGTLSMIDLATLNVITVASGGERGDFLHVGPDGRLYVTESDEIDVFSPIVAPHIVAVNPPNGESVNPIVNTATITFDSDMDDSTDPTDAGSVVNTANYALIDEATGQQLPIGAATYDATTRTVQLWFESLLPGSYTLEVSSTVQNDSGLDLGTAYQSQFSVSLANTNLLQVVYTNTQYDRQTNTISFDVAVQNGLDIPIASPIEVIFTGLPATGDTILDPTGITPNGYPYILLNVPGGELAAGLTSPAILISLPATGTYGDLGAEIEATPGVVEFPTITSTPTTSATVGQAYQYTVQSTDSDGEPVSYLLVEGPTGATLNPTTGVLSWTPPASSATSVSFLVRAYDFTGGFTSQSWTVNVSGVSTAPIISPIANQTIPEGSLIQVPIAATSTSGRSLVYWIENLPPGATFDESTQTLSWQTTYTSAGQYDVTVYASDGVTTASQSFTITVTTVIVPPQVNPLPSRVVNEGDDLNFEVSATDQNGSAIVFSSSSLPAGATISLDGDFDWTPAYDQQGDFAIPITATANGLSTTVTLDVTVLKVEGPISFADIGQLTVYEGQALSAVILVNDSNVASSTPPLQLPDGGTDPNSPPPPVSFVYTALPAGATFNPITETLSWQPGYRQAGTYNITFTATDTTDVGDEYGPPSTATDTVTIIVLPAYSTPAVNPIADQSVMENNSITIPISATNADGNSIVLSAQGLPPFATFADNGNGTATILADPTTGTRGNYIITITAANAADTDVTSSTTFVLNVAAFSEPPVLGYIGPKVAVIGQTLNFDVTASELDQDPLTFTVSGLPAGATLTPTSIYGVDLFSWTPTAADAGAYSAVFSVSNNGNGNSAYAQTVTQTVAFSVVAGDVAPVLLPVSNVNATQLQAVQIQLAGSDSAGNPFSFFASSLPAGAQLNPITGLFTWTPNIAQVGPFTIRFGVTDGSQSSTQAVTITVAPAAIAPTFAPLPPIIGKEGAQLSFVISGGDVDGATLAYSLGAPLPKGATFNAATQVFTWTPAYGQAGQYTLDFVATDPTNSTSATDAVTVTILPTDQPPAIAALGGHVALIGHTFTLTITATPSESYETITYSATGLPAGAALNPTTGVLTWTPSGVQAGTYNVLVTASDGQLTSTQPLTLVASATPILPDVLITVTPSFPVPLGQSVFIQVTASAISSITSLTLTIDGQAVTLNAQGGVYYTPAAAGHYALVATATDADGQTGTETADLKVRNLSDTGTPIVSLALPATGTVLTGGTTSIVGTVSDENLDTYTLDLTPIGSANAVVLATGESTVTNGILAAINPNELQNGAYELTLTASNMAGRSSTTTAVVDIDTATKSGAYSTSASDLTATLDGVSVVLTQYYSSVASAVSGLLGYGWQLGGFDPDITSDVLPTGSESTGVYNPFVVGTNVYFNLPDGQRAGFTFTPTTTIIGPLTVYQPSWTASAGVDYQLTTPQAQLEEAGGQLYQIGTGLPYNPASGRFGTVAWTLTGPDGTQYNYSASGSLENIVSPGGVTLIASDSGLVAPNGQTIAFRTNGSGELAAIIAPDGAQTLFTYNSQGDLVGVNNLQTGTLTEYQYNSANELTAIAQPGGGAAEITYDAQGSLLSVNPVTLDLGTTHQFLGQTYTETHTAGGTERYSFILSSSEIASVLSGTAIFGVEVSSTSGFAPALPVIDGYTAIGTTLQGSNAVALYQLPAAGVYVISVTGANSGSYTLQVYLAGDVNGDGRVDGTDEQLFASALGATVGEPNYLLGADALRDGDITEQDYLILESNFGFVADQPPVAQSTALTTRMDVPVTIDLSTLSSDPQNDLIGYVLTGAVNGTVSLALDGHTATFTPDAGFTGTASFTFTAGDPSAVSDTATVTINVQTSDIQDIQFTQQNLRLNSGQTAVLDVDALYLDGSTGAIPNNQIVFGSTNPSVAVVADNGAIVLVGSGQTILTATYAGLTAATPLVVGSFTPANLLFFPTTYAVTVGQSRQFEVEQINSDGSLTDLSSASSGSIYYLSNPNLGTITADGLFAATATGTELVTTINGGQSEVATITITAPVSGAVTVGSGGVIVSDSSGDQVGIGAGSLPSGTQVDLAPLAESNLPSALPYGFVFADSFSLSLDGADASDPLSLSIPAPAGTVAGQQLYLFRYGTIFLANFTPENIWEVADELVVGTDGYARTASPPYSGILSGGEFVVASVEAEPSGGNGNFIRPADNTPAPVAQVQGGVTGTPTVAIASGNGGNGPAYAVATNGSYNFLLPIYGPTVIQLMAANQYGQVSVKQTTITPSTSGVVQNLGITVQAPPPTENIPEITGFSLGASSAPGVNLPVLEIYGYNFSSILADDLIYILPGNAGGEQAGLVPSLIGNEHPLIPFALQDGNLEVYLPTGTPIGGASVAVGVVTQVSPPAPVGVDATIQTITTYTTIVQFIDSQTLPTGQKQYTGPNYEYVVDSGTNTLEVYSPNAIATGTGTPSGTVGLIATIPVGYDPSQVAVSPDGLTVYVTDTGDGAITVIDALTLSVINIESSQGAYSDNPNPSELKLPGNINGPAAPNYITCGPELSNGTYEVYVDDRHDGNLYIFNSSIVEKAITGTDPQTQITVYDYTQGQQNLGATGIAYDDGSTLGGTFGGFVYIANTGEIDQAGSDDVTGVGYVYIVQVADENDVPINPVTITHIITGPKPYGVAAYNDGTNNYVVVTVRADTTGAGYTVIDADGNYVVNGFPIATELRQTLPSVNPVILQLTPTKVQAQLFDIYNAEAVTFAKGPADPQGNSIYALVLFHNTFDPGNPATDPTYGAGGNVGILANPFGPDPYWVGATAEIPSLNGTFPTGLAVSGDQAYLYVTVTGINQVFVYSLARIWATVSILQALVPNAVDGPSAGQGPIQPLDLWAFDILKAGSLSNFLSGIGINPATSALNLTTGSQPNNIFNANLMTLQSGGPAGVEQYNTIDPGVLPGLDPPIGNYPGKPNGPGVDPLLVADILTGSGTNPEGIASGPKLPTDVIADSATAASGATNGTVFVTYTIVGNVRGTVTVTLMSSVVQTPGGPYFIDTSNTLTQTGAGTYTQAIPVGGPIPLNLGQITVTLMTQYASDDANTSNDTVTCYPVPVGISLQYGESPNIKGTTLPSNVKSFGQFIVGVNLPDTVTILPDPDISGITNVEVVQERNGVTNLAQGTVIYQTPVQFSGTTFQFSYNMGNIPLNTQWLLVETGPTIPMTEIPYTFLNIPLPAYLDPANSKPPYLTISQPIWDPSSQTYEFARQDVIADFSYGLDPTAPILGGKSMKLMFGSLLTFNFDLNGNVTNLNYGPALFYDFLVYANSINIPIQSVDNLLGATGPNDSRSLTITDSNIASILGAFGSHAQEPNEEGEPPATPNAPAEQLEQQDAAANGATPDLGGEANLAASPISASGALSYTSLQIGTNLNIQQGSYNLSLSFSTGVTLSTPKTYFPAPIPVVGAVLQLYYQLSETITPKLTFAMNFSTTSTTVTVAGSLAANLTLTLSGEVGVAALYGALGTASLKISASLGATITYTYQSSGMPVAPTLTFPCSITGVASISTPFLNLSNGSTYTIFNAPDLFSPPNNSNNMWTVFSGSVATSSTVSGFGSSSSPPAPPSSQITSSGARVVQPADQTSPNSTLQTATDLGVPMGTTAYPGEALLSASDANVYNFRLIDPTTSADQITLNFAQPVPGLIAYVQDAEGNLYGSYQATDDSDGTVSLANLQPGNYYLFVEGAPATGVNYSMTYLTPTTTNAALVANLALDKTETEAGQPFTATITIQNLGVAASNPGIAELTWADVADELGSNDPQLVPGGIEVPALAPGQTWTDTVTVISPSTIHGDLYVGLFADVDHQTPQDSMASESATATIELDYPPDALQYNGSFGSATQLGGLVQTITENNLAISSPESGEYFQFVLPTAGTSADMITIQRTDTNADTGLSLYDSNGNYLADAPLSSSGAETLSLNGYAAGIYYFEVYSVDGTSFTYNLSLSSSPRTGPSLAVSTVAAESEILIPGQAQSAQVTIENYGASNAGGFDVELGLYINGAIVDVTSPTVVPQLYAGQTMTLTIPFTTPTLPTADENQYLALVATVDPNNALNSLDPGLDSRYEVVYLTQSADFIHDAPYYGTYNFGPVAGTQSLSNLTLVYGGDTEFIGFQTIAAGGASDEVTVNFNPALGTLDGELLDASGDVLDQIGQVTSGTFTFSLNGLPAGQYYVAVTSDQSGLDPVYSVTINAPNPNGVDLAATGIAVPNPFASGSTAVSATITNLGDEPVGQFEIQYVLTPDGNPYSSEAIDLGSPITINGLAAGASYTDSETFSLSSIPAGAYEIAVIADPNHQIAQTTTENNTAETNLIVAPPADAYEPDNTIETATPLVPVNGEANLSNLTVQNSADVQFFSFTLGNVSSSTDEASISYKSNEPDLTLDLLDSNGNVLSTAAGSGGSAEVSLADLLPGTYYLEVTAPSEFGFSSGYGIAVTSSALVAQSSSSGGDSPGVSPGTSPANAGEKSSTTTSSSSGELATSTSSSTSSSSTTTPPATTSGSPGNSDSHASGGVSPAGSVHIASNPTVVDVPNGGFADDNPSDSGFAWSTIGNVVVSGDLATLTGGQAIVTELSQVLDVPAGATELSFVLNGLNLIQGQGVPPDAFEVGVSDPTNHDALLATDGLPASDGILNIQMNGSTSFGSEVSIPGVSQSGDTFSPTGPVTITINLAGLATGEQFDLAFDLIAFAASSVSISDVTFVGTPPAITSAAGTTLTAGTAGSFTITTTGFPTAAITESGTLPNGLTFVDNGNGTATLSGTPAAGTGGVYTIDLDASNGQSPDALQTFTLVVDQAAAFTSADSATFVAGTNDSFTIQTSGYPIAAITENGGLPNGVTFIDNGNGTATLMGLPAAGTGGVYTIDLDAANGIGQAMQTFTLTVDQAAAFTSANSATFVAGTNDSFTIQTSGYPIAAITEDGGLPNGLTFIDNGNGTAMLMGLAATGTGGVYTIDFDAANGIGQAMQTFTLTVDQAPAFTSSDAATFTAGSSDTFTIQTSGYPIAAISESGGLPDGVTFVDNGNGTATISGIPTGSSGVFTLDLAAANGVGTAAMQTFTLTINGQTSTLQILPPSQITIISGGLSRNNATGLYFETITIKNTTGSAINGPLYLAVEDLVNATLTNAAGQFGTQQSLVPIGSYYYAINFSGDALAAGATATVELILSDPLTRVPSDMLQVLQGTISPDAVTQFVVWTGAAGTTDWNTAANWSSDAVPSASTNVLIPADSDVALGSGSDSVALLILQGNATLDIGDATLFIDYAGAPDPISL
ncbi:MAG TPA: CARDB domain-containing protein, partial [Tepidisphaeraceae bacterium]|nr:CARDB domain-containing protein [Tepidisphaeraceae bacterium]